VPFLFTESGSELQTTAVTADSTVFKQAAMDRVQATVVQQEWLSVVMDR